MKASEQQSLVRTVTKTTVGIADTVVDVGVSVARAKPAIIILAVWVLVEGLANSIFGGSTSFRIVFTGLIDIVITYVLLFVFFFPIKPKKYWKHLLPTIFINLFTVFIHVNYVDFGEQATQALGKIIVFPVLDLLANSIHVLIVYTIVTKKRVVGSIVSLKKQPKVLRPELVVQEVEVESITGGKEMIVQAPPTTDSVFYDPDRIQTTKSGIPIGNIQHVVEELAQGDHTGQLIDSAIPRLREKFRK